VTPIRAPHAATARAGLLSLCRLKTRSYGRGVAQRARMCPPVELSPLEPTLSAGEMSSRVRTRARARERDRAVTRLDRRVKFLASNGVPPRAESAIRKDDALRGATRGDGGVGGNGGGGGSGGGGGGGGGDGVRPRSILVGRVARHAGARVRRRTRWYSHGQKRAA